MNVKSESIWRRDLPMLLSKFYEAKKSSVPPSGQQHLIDLIEWVQRLPIQRPRLVHRSDVLQKNRVLTAYEAMGVDRIAQAAQTGESLVPFLGDTTAHIRIRVNKLGKTKQRTDLFFSDWGLHHFHLGLDIQFPARSARVMRSRRVLVARISHSDIYFLDVVDHGKGFEYVWGNTDYLETLYRNWPSEMEPAEVRLMNIDAERERITAKEYVELRRAGINATITVAGKAFFGLGGGISSDGSSSNAVIGSLQIHRELKHAEALFRMQYPNDSAVLALNHDASLGYFLKEANIFYIPYKDSNRSYQMDLFFTRLLLEIPLIKPNQILTSNGLVFTGSQTQTQ